MCIELEMIYCVSYATLHFGLLGVNDHKAVPNTSFLNNSRFLYLTGILTARLEMLLVTYCTDLPPGNSLLQALRNTCRVEMVQWEPTVTFL